MGKILLGDIPIVDGSTPLTIDTEIKSGSTNPVENKAIYALLQRISAIEDYINNEHPVGSVITTVKNANPGTYLGGTWSLIGGQDSSKVYWPAFAISTDGTKNSVSEKLPNIKGQAKTGLYVSSNNNGGDSGALSRSANVSSYISDSDYRMYSAYSIQLNAHNSNSIYQDGAHVQVESIKLFFWERIS